MTETLNEESDKFLAQPFLLKEAWNDLDLMIEMNRKKNMPTLITNSSKALSQLHTMVVECLHG